MEPAKGVRGQFFSLNRNFPPAAAGFSPAGDSVPERVPRKPGRMPTPARRSEAVPRDFAAHLLNVARRKILTGFCRIARNSMTKRNLEVVARNGTEPLLFLESKRQEPVRQYPGTRGIESLHRHDGYLVRGQIFGWKVLPFGIHPREAGSILCCPSCEPNKATVENPDHPKRISITSFKAGPVADPRVPSQFTWCCMARLHSV